MLKGTPEGFGESACSCAGFGMRLDWSPTSIHTHRWGDRRGTWQHLGPGAGEGLQWHPRTLARGMAKLDPACELLWRGHGHAGYKTLPAQEHPCTVERKRIFEVGSPARVGSCNRVFWHHLLGGGCSKPTGIFILLNTPLKQLAVIVAVLGEALGRIEFPQLRYH